MSNNKYKVLIVEDDRSIASFIQLPQHRFVR